MEEKEGLVIGLDVLGDIPLCSEILYLRFLLVSPTYRALQLRQINSYITLEERSRGTVSLNLKKDPIVKVLGKTKAASSLFLIE